MQFFFLIYGGEGSIKIKPEGLIFGLHADAESSPYPTIQFGTGTTPIGRCKIPIYDVRWIHPSIPHYQ
jgi:hypothetical protein